MDNSYEFFKTYPESTPIINTESKECFICREGEEMGQDALLHFCDCKNLIAHQQCMLTWIQKGSYTEDHPRCKVCTAEYQLQKGSIWRFLFCQWQNWIFFFMALAVMAIIPFAVYQMMVAFKNPPPSTVFHAAAICFGVLTETLLIKYLMYYCGNKYNKAKISSFSVRARTVRTI
ncbi:hypothetical protein Y1Q_0007554 [Alligator mississippiensis]|uniref:RING-CH-type domain-containing protein n=1 Tax=Alligator mississippiensis TaxID=8496 RepID=A0A151M551_ALLMI|nr:hypothetical protein Y1Q_0007554 [Alligator mississippiensis]